MEWWLWMLLGLFLLVAEQVIPGFFALFFAFGAVVVGILVALLPAVTETEQWLVFSVVSSLALVLLRRMLLRRVRPATRDIDSLENEIAVASEDIVAGDVGQVQLRGSVWNARNVGDCTVARAQRCR